MVEVQLIIESNYTPIKEKKKKRKNYWDLPSSLVDKTLHFLAGGTKIPQASWYIKKKNSHFLS